MPRFDIFIHGVNNDAMNDRAQRPRRHRWIAQLIERGHVENQEQLQSLLAERSVRVAQATLSRDLRELGVVKGPAGYALPGTVSAAPGAADERALAESLGALLLRAQRGGNLVVLNTGPGHAQALALAIDRAELAGVLGTVAGDDTVFVAARSERAARELLETIKTQAGLSP
jgi:transcriptional regulator of arginine metabolism